MKYEWMFVACEIHRYTLIKKRMTSTNLDHFTGDATSSSKDVNLHDISICPQRDEMDLLFCRDRRCPLCQSSNLSRSGNFVRTLESGQPILIRK